MLDAIVQIGGALLEGGDLLSNLIQNVPPVKKGKRLQVLKINFFPDEDKIEIDGTEEMSETSANNYVHVGSADGPNSPQWYATSTSPDYFLTETFYNLKAIDFGKELNEKITRVFESFYTDLGDGLKPKYRYALDLKKAGISQKSPNQLLDELRQRGIKQEDVGKELRKVLRKEFESHLKNSSGLKLNEIGLFVLMIDGKPISQAKEYKKAVIEAKKPRNAGEQVKNNGRICSICGSKEDVTEDLSGMKIKYYTTNQIIFASNLNKKNYFKNMQLCQQCLNKLLSGENYVKNYLNTTLGNFDLYIIPHFIYGSPINSSELDFIKGRINNSFNLAKNLQDMEELRDDIRETLDLKEEDYYFLLNFVFYEQSQQATKIQRLVKDVSPSIFEKVGEAIISARRIIKNAINENLKLLMNLQTIYYMVPVRLSQGKCTEFKDVMDLYDAIFTTQKINNKRIIDNLVEIARIIRLAKDGYNVRPQEESLEFFMVRANMFIKFLENLGCLEGGETLDVSTLNLNEDIKNYIQNMKYDEQQTAMFLLGYFIGEVGNAQRVRMNGEKPILNKLNFNGIDRMKIKKLANEVFNKLNQEKIRKFHEVTYFEFKKILDKNLDRWKLNKNENLFYILSGYSFATVKPMLKGGEHDEQR